MCRGGPTYTATVLSLYTCSSRYIGSGCRMSRIVCARACDRIDGSARGATNCHAPCLRDIRVARRCSRAGGGLREL